MSLLFRPRRIGPIKGKGGRGPVRNKPVILSNGHILAPASVEKTVGYKLGLVPGYGVVRRPEVIWDAFVDRSEDEGKTWKKTKKIPYDREERGEMGGIIQPALWESSPGRVHMFLRSTEGVLFRSDSDDYGKTWSEEILRDCGDEEFVPAYAVEHLIGFCY